MNSLVLIDRVNRENQGIKTNLEIGSVEAGHLIWSLVGFVGIDGVPWSE